MFTGTYVFVWTGPGEPPRDGGDGWDTEIYTPNGAETAIGRPGAARVDGTPVQQFRGADGRTYAVTRVTPFPFRPIGG